MLGSRASLSVAYITLELKSSVGWDHRGLQPVARPSRLCHGLMALSISIAELGARLEDPEQRLSLLDAVFILATSFIGNLRFILAVNRIIVCKGTLEGVVHQITLVKRGASSAALSAMRSDWVHLR